MRNMRLKNTVLSAMFICVGLILPFFTGQLKQIGNMLLPMHIPVMLCGFICGPWFGFVTGFVLPVMRSALFSMPVMYPNAVAMAFELSVYGFVTGFIYMHSKKTVLSVYISLVSAMVLGRIIWGIVWTSILGLGNYTWQMFMTGAVYNSIPGIIIQLVIIPILVTGIKKINTQSKRG